MQNHWSDWCGRQNESPRHSGQTWGGPPEEDSEALWGDGASTEKPDCRIASINEVMSAVRNRHASARSFHVPGNRRTARCPASTWPDRFSKGPVVAADCVSKISCRSSGGIPSARFAFGTGRPPFPGGLRKKAFWPSGFSVLGVGTKNRRVSGCCPDGWKPTGHEKWRFSSVLGTLSGVRFVRTDGPPFPYMYVFVGHCPVPLMRVLVLSTGQTGQRGKKLRKHCKLRGETLSG